VVGVSTRIAPLWFVVRARHPPAPYLQIMTRIASARGQFRPREIGFLYAAETAFRTVEVVIMRFFRHGTISRLARSAAFNANLPCWAGTSFVARIFSMTRSIK
jgi:hypothetical protein